MIYTPNYCLVSPSIPSSYQLSLVTEVGHLLPVAVYRRLYPLLLRPVLGSRLVAAHRRPLGCRHLALCRRGRCLPTPASPSSYLPL